MDDTHIQLRYPNLSHIWPQNTRPDALKMAAKAPTTARKKIENLNFMSRLNEHLILENDWF